MPGLAKCERRAETSGVGLVDDFGDLDGEARGDPEMRRGCRGRFPGSSEETGTGIVEGEESIRRRSEGEGKGEGGHGCVLES